MSVTHISGLAFLQLPWWWHETALFQANEGRTVRHGRSERSNDFQVLGQYCRGPRPLAADAPQPSGTGIRIV
jgi:hypothetical protein